MSELEEKYNLLWDASFAQFLQKGVDIDSNIYSKRDSRKGITLIAKFSPCFNVPLNKNVNNFLQKLKSVELKQYYYSENELHLTVLSLVSCNEHFSIEQININDYISIITNATVDISPFDINFKGITASSSCIMLQGFPLTNTLLHLRNRLRLLFAQSGLFNTIDERYKIDTAHSTVLRFQYELKQNKEFLHLLEQFRNVDFGNLHVKELQLVYNDWYHKEDKTVVLSTIKL